MGLIKTSKLANGNIGLEITYGGKEAPFGGIDSSMPPQYIDPLCATDVQGFIVVNGQYVAVALEPLPITLNLPASGFSTPKLGGFGSFYTKVQGYQNFVYIVGDSSTNTTNQTVTTNVCLFVWPSSNIATPVAIPLVFTQPILVNAAVQATLQVLTTIISNPSGSFGNVTATLINDTGLVTETYGPYASSLTQNALITALVNDITSRPSAICTAVVNADTISATLTSIAAGAVSNSTSFSAFGAAVGAFKGSMLITNTGFQGGKDAYTYPTGIAPFPLSYVSEGENLYLGGPGTLVLQYTNQIFSILEQYVGANVLRKFAGSLLALGITPSPGTVIQSAEMVLAWSASGKFAIWNPTDTNGNVTGAGFEQLADIEDILTGGFVNNSTLIILRSKGVSYATATGSAELPFDINHIDLASEGEGCQSSLLSSQYGPIGFYVGNSNVYEFVQNSKPIGDRINNYLYPMLSPTAGTNRATLVASKAVAPFFLGMETVLYSVFVKQGTIAAFLFLYNPVNNTWTRVPFGPSFIVNVDSLYLEDFPVLNATGSQFQRQPQLILGTGASTTKTFSFYLLEETLPDTASPSSGTNYFIDFPAEEISHGRDITIDGVYVTCAGKAGQIIFFEVKDPSTGLAVAVATLILPVGASYSTLAEYQVFFASTGVSLSTVTVKCPQLSVQFPVGYTAGSINPVRIAKISMFGSFDPEQRPV